MKENKNSEAHNGINKKKRFWITLGIVISLLLLGLGAYAYNIYNNIDKTYKPLKREKSEKREIKISIKRNDPIAVLLLGVDKRKGDKGRSDTMIVTTINPKDKTMKILSIPRDARVEIVGKGIQDKINHSFAFGGVEMSIHTVEKFLDIPIDYYIQLNMEGLAEIIDQVGGIQINSPIAFREGGRSFIVGTNNLNGKDALIYVRMRKKDPKGDFGRQERQRIVIEELLNRLISVDSVPRLNGIVRSLGDNISTNLKVSEAMDMREGYGPARNNNETLNLEGSDQKINGIYYFVPKQESVDAIIATFKRNLELNTQTSSE
ncbi:MAG: lytR [Bacillales bacterium]|nr:lytR [Bacillales bacterium]